jgi:hypothetical protein
MKRRAQGSASELRSYDEKKPRKRAENHTMERGEEENDVGEWKDRAVASGKRKTESMDIRGVRPACISFFITIAPI